MTATDTELVERRFWLSLREPGCVPECKGPWPIEQTAKVLREFIAARSTAYIDYITVDSSGAPHVQHGPEVLQIADGRSMATGRKHNQRTRQAEALAARIAELEAALEPHEVFWMLFADDGQSIRKWSRVPFEGARMCRVALSHA